ncbi:prolipoprotein diacylglyceryl transferase [Candidatus Curtissbacteria bacterium RIFCSPLOWO2_02_FULL_40_11]|nr:MAG: prolipoprotein diacylglyceryl transferase [Candidatus Curtissbacteria bacterium RIFCSPLOWO2_02_FULL_40_11]
MLPRSVEAGPISIHLYGLLIAAAIYIGWYLAKKRAHFYQIPIKIFDDPILLIPLAFSIIGARLYHVIDFWKVYRADPVSIFYIANGGLGIWGGLLGLFIGFYIVAKIKKIDLFAALDLVAPSIILGQAIGRVGNYINQEGFGPPTNLPWGVFIERQNRPTEFVSSTHFHPTFFYEAVLNFIFFAVLFKIAPNLKKKGQVFAIYLIFYSASRLISEFFRIDTWTIGEIKIAHVISVTVFIIGFCLFMNLKTARKKYNGVDRN